MTHDSTLALLLDIDGAGSHPAAWRAAHVAPADLLGARYLASTVQAAERAGFAAAVFDDHPLPQRRTDGPTARVDAVLRASFVAPLTSAIGLIPVVHSLYNEPFHIATQIASLDEASHGRAGWLVVGDPDPAIAARHGRAPLAAADVEPELRDVVEAVRRLWDSWEDDAVIRDAATGRYFDRDRVHYADFEGVRFSVKGPSILPRSPQGQPLVVAGAPAGGATAEVDLRPVDLEVILDRAGQTAADRLAELDAGEVWPRRPGVERYVGDAGGLVERLSALAAEADAIRIQPAVLDLDVDELARGVLPALRAAGVATPPRPGDSLRHTVGLATPANRFTTAGANR